MRKDYSHEIVVDRPISEAFALFTPKGEEAWVPGWEPVYFSPATGETCEEMIFTTGDGEEMTFWTCLKWQPEHWHVRYLRLTPASRVSFVDVQCEPKGDDRTRVRVVYQTKALTPSGRSYISDLSQSAFAQTIDEWSGLIQQSA
jgi:hypothetical protein